MVLMVVVMTLFLFRRYVIGGWNENESTVSAGEVWPDSVVSHECGFRFETEWATMRNGDGSPAWEFRMNKECDEGKWSTRFGQLS